jgi:hypothetical protein
MAPYREGDWDPSGWICCELLLLVLVMVLSWLEKNAAVGLVSGLSINKGSIYLAKCKLFLLVNICALAYRCCEGKCGDEAADEGEARVVLFSIMDSPAED